MNWVLPPIIMPMSVAALVCWLGGVAVGWTQEESREILLDIGSMVPKPLLGFGWGVSERTEGRAFRWIQHLEADITIELDRVGDADLWIRAGVQYLPYIRQTVSVYFNDRYVGEWVCVDRPGFTTYHLTAPARALRIGANRMTLRMAYRKRVGPDPRELALCVDTVRLRVH